MRKLKAKAKKREMCYPEFDTFLDQYMEALLKEERKKKNKSHPKDKKEMLASLHSVQPRKNIPLARGDIKKAQKRLRNKGKRKS